MRKLISLLLVVVLLLSAFPVTAAAADMVDEYLYVLGYAAATSFTTEQQAQVVLQDGTVKIIDLAAVHNGGAGVANKTVYNYTVDANGKYILYPVENNSLVVGTKVINKVPAVGAHVADAKTAFVLGIKDPVTMGTEYVRCTGISSIPSFAVKTTAAKYAVNPTTGRIAFVIAEEIVVDDSSTYGITVQQTENGTITVSETEACIGQCISVQTTPAEGCVFSHLLVNGKMVCGTEFMMLAEPVEISAVFLNLSELQTGYLYVLGAAATTCFTMDYSAQVVFEDGTIQIVDLAAVHNGGVGVRYGGVYKYFVEPNGKYRLDSVATGTATSITNKVPTIGNHVANTKTKFVIGITYGVFTGIQNVPSVSTRYRTIEYVVDSVTGTIVVAFCTDAILDGTVEPKTLTVRQTENGTLRLDKAEASFGECVFAQVSPANGYVFSHLIVNGKKVYGTSFIMPTEAATVSVVFAKIVQGDYLYVLGYAAATSFTTEQQAQVVFEDGTVKIVDLSPLHNSGTGVTNKTIYGYTVDDEEKYTLSAITNSSLAVGQSVASKVSTIGTNTADAKTRFVLGSKNAVTMETTYTTYIGIDNVPDFDIVTTSAKYALDPQSGNIAILYAEDVESYFTSTATMALYKTGLETPVTSDNGTTYFSVPAVVDGVITDVKIHEILYYLLTSGRFTLVSGGKTDMLGIYIAVQLVESAGGIASGQQTWEFSADDFQPYSDGIIYLDCAKYVEEGTPVVLWDMTNNKLHFTTIEKLLELEEGTTGIYTTAPSANGITAGDISTIYGVVRNWKSDTPDIFDLYAIDTPDDFEIQFLIQKENVSEGFGAKITRNYADGRSATTRIVPADEWEDYSSNLYCISYDDIDAKGMNDQICLEIMDGENNVVCTWQGTVQELWEEKLNVPADEGAKNKTLAQLGYSAAARSFFGYNDGEADDFAADVAALMTAKADDIAAVRKDESRVTGDVILGSSMVLDSAMTMRFYFNTGDITVTVNGETATVQTVSGKTYSYCEVPVTAENIFDAVEITVSRNGETLAEALDSPAGYFARLYATGEEKAKALADAYLLYGLVSQ